MNTKLESKLSIEKKEDGTFSIQGTLDETVSFDPLLEDKSQTLNIYFGKIKRVTSFGIKKWVIFMNQIKEKQVRLHKCPIVIIEQINMIPDFLSHAEVVSFSAPFVCGNCEKEHEKEFNYSDALQEGFLDSLNQKFKCDCGHEDYLEFDDDRNIYFGFVKK